jgi:hypothetical protein
MATYQWDIATYFPNGLGEHSLYHELKSVIPADTQPHGLTVIATKADRDSTDNWVGGLFTLETARALTAPELTTLETYFTSHTGAPPELPEWTISRLEAGTVNGELRWCSNTYGPGVGYWLYWDGPTSEWRSMSDGGKIWPP